MNYLVVPYRNRADDLAVFLKDMPPMLDEVLGAGLWKIVIAEQHEGRLFNRGLMCNIGFLETCDVSGNFIFSDVDVIPTHPESKARYAESCADKIVGIYNSIHDTLGGVVKLRGDWFQKANGFPNTYWGWGVEDKALQNRIELHGFPVHKRFLNTPDGKAYFHIRGEHAERPQDSTFSERTTYCYNRFRTLPHDEKVRSVMSDGLSTILYSVVERLELAPHVVKIKANV